jgi:hypothetical protein
LGHVGRVLSVRFSPDGQFLATAGSADAEANDKKSSSSPSGPPMVTATSSPLASFSGLYTIRIWRLTIVNLVPASKPPM